MSFFKPEFFIIECITNTQVGSGNANYGVIDNLVQRDVTTHFPVINSSSLKGALKEFCTHIQTTNDDIKEDDIKKVFGSSKTTPGDTSIGLYKFFDASILSIPVRSDKRPYVHITCPLVLKTFAEKMLLFGTNHLAKDILNFSALIQASSNLIDDTAYCFNENLNGAVLEDFEFTCKNYQYILPASLKELFSEEIVLVSDYIFKTLTNDLHLPVIARNHLENGESQNLWYEQVIPSKTNFWFTLLKPSTEMISSFDNLIVADNSVIQIGANATVGYGYTKFKKINF